MSSAAAFPFTIRPPREDELDALVDLMNACSLVDIGVPDTKREEILWFWRKSTFDPARDAWVVEDEKGRLIGSCDVELETSEGGLLIDAYTHPECLRRGIGTRLGDLAERCAIEVAAERGMRPPVELFQGAWTESPAARFLEARGYEMTRCFVRMRIDMDEPPPEPIWPEGVTVAGFERGRDERLFHESLEEAFRDHWRWSPTPFGEWQQGMIEHDDGFDGSLWFRAMDGDQVAGAIVGRPRSAEDPEAGWIQDLAVRRPWRRRGVGLALLQHEFGVLFRRGLRAALLEVDADSPTGAARLYERAGMREVRRIDVYAKTIG